MIIGVLGGGQLARMLALAGIPMGHQFVFFDPAKDCCAASLGTHIHGDYEDQALLKKFADSVDIVTFEFENVSLKSLNFLAELKPVYPNPSALNVKQDRLLEKQLFNSLNIPTVKFMNIDSWDKLQQAAQDLGLPLVLKSRFGGYDGKGQIVVKCEEDLSQAWQEIENVPFIAEEWIHYSREVSIIAVKSRSGECAYYDLSENNHSQGILHSAYNRPDDPMFNSAVSLINKLIQNLDYVGTLTLELFQVGDELKANEFAPRVHNSGHWSIENCHASQFENHLRAILDLPLGDTSSLELSAMINFIGNLPAIESCLKTPGSHYHSYGKEIKQGRKLGHLTICAKTSEELAIKVSQAKLM